MQLFFEQVFGKARKYAMIKCDGFMHIIECFTNKCKYVTLKHAFQLTMVLSSRSNNCCLKLNLHVTRKCLYHPIGLMHGSITLTILINDPYILIYWDLMEDKGSG